MSQVRILSFRPKKKKTALAVAFFFFDWDGTLKLFCTAKAGSHTKVSRSVAELPCHSDHQGTLVAQRSSVFFLSGQIPVFDVCYANRILFRLWRMFHSDQKSRIILIRLFLSKPQVWYIIAVRRISSALWTAYHHSLECIFLRFDDIQCFALMICRNKLRMIYKAIALILQQNLDLPGWFSSLQAFFVFSRKI